METPYLIGAEAPVTGELEPGAQVGNETWTAVTEDGNVIAVTESVTVLRVDALLLTVIYP